MGYHQPFIEKVKSQPITLGVRLGRWAIYLDLPAAKIARAVGATRQSVYNWMKGGTVLSAYVPNVTRVLACMQESKTAEEAWRKICLEFNLQN